MSKKTIVWIVVGVAITSLAGMVIVSKRTHAPSSPTSPRTELPAGTLPDIKVTYQLSDESQKLYSMTVESSTADGQAVLVHGKACNTMNSTIMLLPKGQTTDKKVVKTLNDGRQVLEPMTMSTLMACAETTPQTDDTALNTVINNLALTIQSF